MKAPRACPIHTLPVTPSAVITTRANFARERSSVSRRTQFTGAQKQPHFLGGSGSGSGADIIGTFTFGTCEQTHGAGTSEGRDGGGLARCGGAGASICEAHSKSCAEQRPEERDPQTRLAVGAGTSLDVAGVARAFISGIFGIETFGIEKDGIFGIDFAAALLQAHAQRKVV